MEMRPKGRQGLTTGEAAKMLGVSALSVERLFDKGILIGWKHPITHWRIIDLESVKALKALKRKWNVTYVTQKRLRSLGGESQPKRGIP